MPGSDELLYGRDGLSPDLHAGIDESLREYEEEKRARELSRVRHEGLNEFGHRVVFWTEPCEPSISFEAAVERRLLHRPEEDGPAVEHYHESENRIVVRSWYLDGTRHRQGGPAIDGPADFREYWLNGVQMTEAQWRRLS